MVIENFTSNLNSSGLVETLVNLPGISNIIKIGTAVGIAILVYIVFLIIQGITRILYSLRFKKMTKNVEEINNKMDILISKLAKEYKEKESKAKKK